MAEKIKTIGDSVEKEITGENTDPKADIKLQANENIAASFDDQLSDSLENQESSLLGLQNQILGKPNMTDHHKQRLQKKTDSLIENNDKDGLEQLDNNINFSEKGGLIINTPNGLLTFAPHQARYQDVEDMDGIKLDRNVWTTNREAKTPVDKGVLDDVLSDLALDDVISGSSSVEDFDLIVYEKGLWVNFAAIETMQKAGKKICTAKQYLAAATAFPGGVALGDSLNNPNWSTKVTDLFDLLGVNQFGFMDYRGWHADFRTLWSSSDSSDRADHNQSAYDLRCNDNIGGFHLYGPYNKNSAYGVWFLED